MPEPENIAFSQGHHLEHILCHSISLQMAISVQIQAAALWFTHNKCASPQSKYGSHYSNEYRQKKYEREYAAMREKAEREAVTAARDSYQPPAPQDFSAQRPIAAPKYTPPSYSREAQAQGGEARYRGGNLPTNSNVKPEFQTSGSWKTQPSGG